MFIKSKLSKLGYDEAQADIIKNAIKKFGTGILSFFQDELLTSEQIKDVVDFFEYDDKMLQFYLLRMSVVKRSMLIKCYNNFRKSKDNKEFGHFEIQTWRMIYDVACSDEYDISILSKLISRFEENPLDYEFFNKVRQNLESGDVYEFLNVTRKNGMSK